jgi:hypothetical protein
MDTGTTTTIYLHTIYTVLVTSSIFKHVLMDDHPTLPTHSSHHTYHLSFLETFNIQVIDVLSEFRNILEKSISTTKFFT